MTPAILLVDDDVFLLTLTVINSCLRSWLPGHDGPKRRRSIGPRLIRVDALSLSSGP